MHCSARTAITRSKLSAPAAHLLEQGLLCGRILDYGCGRGDLARFLDGDILQWDPHHFPEMPKGKFDVVTMIYVLNVLDPDMRGEVFEHAKSFVKRNGSLYIAVRRDLKTQGKTSVGTFQYNVTLDLPSIVNRAGGFQLYEWSRP
jgi:ATP adenylyltransferase